MGPGSVVLHMSQQVVPGVGTVHYLTLNRHTITAIGDVVMAAAPAPPPGYTISSTIRCVQNLGFHGFLFGLLYT